MKKSFLRKLSLTMAAIMAFSATALSTGANAAQTESPSLSASLPENISDGAILHCWSWSFNTIKEKIPQIAEAGFTAIQTSPINAIWRGDNGGMSLMSPDNGGTGKWWYQYQPTDYTIGNYMFGTKAEFTQMCEQAHKYGVKVVVDIVANHCSSNYNVISSHVKNITTKPFHDRLEISDWSNRKQVTQGKLTGLYDLNTQDKKVQKMITDYMAEVREAGADGFRFDAAKHIELPDDDAEFAGDFWPTILDNDAQFQYGEILSGGDRASDYAKLMNITAEGYGKNIRLALSKNLLSASLAKSYGFSDVDASQLVTWVESHDNYTGDGSWSLLDNEKVQQGWAVIAAQGDTTPLFFARPKGSSTGNQWGENTIGIDGDGNYFSDEVKWVNKFRNAMVGETKRVADAGKYKCTMIERGKKGAVLVNTSNEDVTVNVRSNLEAGEYTDQVSGDKFTVSGSKITGTVRAGQVAVVYTPEEEPELLIGDVNRNGVVDIGDATELQRHLAEYLNDDGTPIIDVNDPEQFTIADFDRSGTITVQDVTEIQKYLSAT